MTRRGLALALAGALVAAGAAVLLLGDRAEAGGDFWLELRRCESSDGARSPNLYQLTPDTAAKVGLPNPGAASPARQLEAAQAWAARIHPDEATRAGWPTCWPIALARSASTPSPAEQAPPTPPPAPRVTPSPSRIALTG